MWRILNAEIRYNWLNFVVMLALVPLVLALQIRYRWDYLAFLVYFLMLLSVNGWNVRYIQEKRDYQCAQLPVPTRAVAAARILIVVLGCAVFTGWFVGLRAVFAPSVHGNFRSPLALFGLLVMAYSLAFIFRDRFIGSRALMRGKILLVAALGALLVINVITMLTASRARAEGGPPPLMVRVFDFVERHSPTTSDLNTAVWLAVSLVLACLTIVTYTRRRSQI
jgi:hypothetical protein